MGAAVGFGDRFERSVSTFMGKVWPLVREKFGPGELIPVEDLDGGPLARLVDTRCGIDHVFCPSEGDPFGIAQRTCNGAWNSFTMNVTTYHRLMMAWKRPYGRIVPSVIIQSYVEAERVQSIGIIRTDDLLRYASEHAPVEKQGPRGPFYVWTFIDLLQAGLPVDLFPAPVLRDPFG